MEKIWPIVMQYGLPILGTLAALVAAGFLSKWFRLLIESSLDRLHVEKTLVRFLGSAAKWTFLILVLVGCMGVFGIQTVSFAAAIGAAGLAIGLALQGSLTNLAAGIMLLILRPFKVGDVITVAGQTGKIEEIDLLTTVMDTPDNRRIILPNNTIFGSIIENNTCHSLRRADLVIPVEAGANVELTRRTLLQVPSGVAFAVPEPAPAVLLMELTERAALWQVRVWAKKEDLVAARDACLRSARQALDEAGIRPPMPALDWPVAFSVPIAPPPGQQPSQA